MAKDKLSDLLDAAAEVAIGANLLFAGDIVRHPVIGPAYVPPRRPTPEDAEFRAAMESVGIRLGAPVLVPGWGEGYRLDY